MRFTRSIGFAALVGALVAAGCAGSDGDGSSADTVPDVGDPASSYAAQVGELPAAAVDIMTEDPYRRARWSYVVAPLDSESPVLARDVDVLTPMGSNTKLYTVGSWVDAVGADSTLTTPVHRVGDDLVLVGAGDLTLGGRQAPTGTLAYSIPPQPDANGIPGAKPAPGDPLTGLDDLARQVKAAGVDSAAQVVVDDRLFEQWYSHEEVISPIVVNDNLFVVQVGPGAVGEPATVRAIPDTAAFTVDNQATTVAAGGDTSIELLPAETTVQGDPIGTAYVVQGTIAADSEPALGVAHVTDPASFARTLFIEALERAGVSVGADPTAPNPVDGLPDDYPADSQVVAYTSPTAEATATLIWKISHNYGANLATCLLAVHHGSTDCEDGLREVRANTQALGITDRDAWIIDGSGETFSSNTPEAMITWVRWLRGRPWGGALSRMLPILGVDGSLGLTQQDTPATGKVQGKSGTWAGLDPSTDVLVTPVQAVAGLMQGDDGREYVFAIYAQSSTFESLAEGVIKGTNDVNDVAAAFQESLP